MTKNTLCGGIEYVTKVNKKIFEDLCKTEVGKIMSENANNMISEDKIIFTVDSDICE